MAEATADPSYPLEPSPDDMRSMGQAALELLIRFVGDLPAPPDLVERALEMYAAEVEGAARLAAEVTKSIPLASGLAGGSADAAAALLGADTAGGGRMTRDHLEAMGRRLGSDVTFCLRGARRWPRGRATW